MDDELSDEDKRLIMELMVGEVFHTGYTKLLDTKRPTSSLNASSESKNNIMFDKIIALDPTFFENDSFELTKEIREMIIMDAFNEFSKSRPVRNTKDEEHINQKADDTVNLLSTEDEDNLRALIASKCAIKDEEVDDDEDCNVRVHEEDASFLEVKCKTEYVEPPYETRVNSFDEESVIKVEVKPEVVTDNAMNISGNNDGFAKPDFMERQDSKRSIQNHTDRTDTKNDELLGHLSENDNVDLGVINLAGGPLVDYEECIESHKISVESTKGVRKTLTDSELTDSMTLLKNDRVTNTKGKFEKAAEIEKSNVSLETGSYNPKNNTLEMSFDKEPDIVKPITLLKTRWDQRTPNTKGLTVEKQTDLKKSNALMETDTDIPITNTTAMSVGKEDIFEKPTNLLKNNAITDRQQITVDKGANIKKTNNLLKTVPENNLLKASLDNPITNTRELAVEKQADAINPNSLTKSELDNAITNTIGWPVKKKTFFNAIPIVLLKNGSKNSISKLLESKSKKGAKNNKPNNLLQTASRNTLLKTSLVNPITKTIGKFEKTADIEKPNTSSRTDSYNPINNTIEMSVDKEAGIVQPISSLKPTRWDNPIIKTIEPVTINHKESVVGKQTDIEQPNTVMETDTDNHIINTIGLPVEKEAGSIKPDNSLKISSDNSIINTKGLAVVKQADIGKPKTMETGLVNPIASTIELSVEKESVFKKPMRPTLLKTGSKNCVTNRLGVVIGKRAINKKPNNLLKTVPENTLLKTSLGNPITTNTTGRFEKEAESKKPNTSLRTDSYNSINNTIKMLLDEKAGIVKPIHSSKATRWNNPIIKTIESVIIKQPDIEKSNTLMETGTDNHIINTMGVPVEKEAGCIKPVSILKIKSDKSCFKPKRLPVVKQTEIENPNNLMETGTDNHIINSMGLSVEKEAGIIKPFSILKIKSNSSGINPKKLPVVKQADIGKPKIMETGLVNPINSTIEFSINKEDVCKRPIWPRPTLLKTDSKNCVTNRLGVVVEKGAIIYNRPNNLLNTAPDKRKDNSRELLGEKYIEIETPSALLKIASDYANVNATGVSNEKEADIEQPVSLVETYPSNHINRARNMVLSVEKKNEIEKPVALLESNQDTINMGLSVKKKAVVGLNSMPQEDKDKTIENNVEKSFPIQDKGDPVNWQIAERQNICNSSRKLPMDDEDGPFFIDRQIVPIFIYEDGLASERWNPTQVLYEICSQCKWSSPEFTLLLHQNHTPANGFHFSVTVQGRTFIPNRRATTKKQAKHYASTHFLNLIGFKFTFGDPKPATVLYNALPSSGKEITDATTRDSTVRFNQECSVYSKEEKVLNYFSEETRATIPIRDAYQESASGSISGYTQTGIGITSYNFRDEPDEPCDRSRGPSTISERDISTHNIEDVIAHFQRVFPEDSHRFPPSYRAPVSPDRTASSSHYYRGPLSPDRTASSSHYYRTPLSPDRTVSSSHYYRGPLSPDHRASSPHYYRTPLSPELIPPTSHYYRTLPSDHTMPASHYQGMPISDDERDLLSSNHIFPPSHYSRSPEHFQEYPLSYRHRAHSHRPPMIVKRRDMTSAEYRQYRD